MRTEKSEQNSEDRLGPEESNLADVVKCIGLCSSLLYRNSSWTYSIAPLLHVICLPYYSNNNHQSICSISRGGDFHEDTNIYLLPRCIGDYIREIDYY